MTKLKTFKLKNGISVATYSLPEMRSVFVSQNVKAGSIFDTKVTSGVAHFMEHILFEGIPSYPNVSDLTNFVESISASFNASTSINLIRFYINGPRRHLDEMLSVAAEVFFEPLFPDAGVEKERGAILQEIASRKDSLNYKLWRFFADTRYKPHNPMQLDGGGEQNAILKATTAELKAYWQRFFLPSNTYIVVVGGFDNDKIEKLIESKYGNYNIAQSFEDYPHITGNDLSDFGVFVRTDQSLGSVYVDLSFESINDQEPLKKFVSARLINRILYNQSSSRLYRLLREQLGLIYSISGWYNSQKYFGLAGVSFQVSIENLDQVLKLVVAEMHKFYKSGALESELELAKKMLIDSVEMSFDHPGNIAEWIESRLLWEDSIALPDEHIKLIESVTKQDLLDLMRQHWNFANLNLTLQGPIKPSPKYAKILQELKDAKSV